MKIIVGSTTNTIFLGLAILLGALWITVVQANAQWNCQYNCPEPVNCQGGDVYDYQYMGSVGSSVCPWYQPCCTGFICWWEDSIGYCGNSDMELCTNPENCML